MMSAGGARRVATFEDAALPGEELVEGTAARRKNTNGVRRPSFDSQPTRSTKMVVPFSQLRAGLKVNCSSVGVPVERQVYQSSAIVDPVCSTGLLTPYP